MNDKRTVTVKQLNLYVKSLLESDPRLSDISVCGEISNFKNHYSSGHWYFTLKDNDSSVRCVMFRSCTSRVPFPPQDGMSVVLRGRASVYEKDGQYQFYAEEMHEYGKGDLAAKFELIKHRLKEEGLFDPSGKRPLEKYPRRIAVITSDTGAAICDIINILKRRYPVCDVVVCPVLVQGDTAPSDMTAMLDRVYAIDGIDTIIIGRGGGSAEDLSAFNDEYLARRIYESPVPVISAVGHETDFTICDFVADVRASTPSHAAELAVPDISEILSDISDKIAHIRVALKLRYDLSSLRYDSIISAKSFSRPNAFLERRMQSLDMLYDKIISSEKTRAAECSAKLSQAAVRLDALSPLKVLSRGFVTAEMDGKVVKSVSSVAENDKIKLTFCDGTADCTVNKTSGKE